MKIKNILPAMILGLVSIFPEATFAAFSLQNTDPVALGLPANSIYGVLSTLLYWLIAILGIIALIAFVVSGLMYLMAAGDDDMIDRAKNAMKWSIVGIAVALSGYIILSAIMYWLSGTTTVF